ncbi:hypothetical protein OsJ_16575 [Oryza sativa Japonica Group]|uniref:Shattering protein n=1 Tax=Oryza sativa subsp. japonica TaxID=39947 RepID=A3AYH6_ORYSJ|nr:hypothetical protein OsJ_16575 [Oryza sativa Japonica Group]
MSGSSADPSPSASTAGAAVSPLALLRAHGHGHGHLTATPPSGATGPAPPPPSPASGSAPRDYRKGNWTLHETLILITANRLDDDRRAGLGAPPAGAGGAGSPRTPRLAEQRWKWVENYCWKNGCLRSQNQCNDKWTTSSATTRRGWENKAACSVVQFMHGKAEEEMSGSSESGEEEEGSGGEPEAKRRRLSRLGSSVVRSATVVARTLVAFEEKRERRHRELLQLEEPRLRLEEERTEVRRQGFAGLIAAVNSLSSAIQALVSDHRSGDSSGR